MLHYMITEFGNASSTDHLYGDRAAQAVSKARSELLPRLNSTPCARSLRQVAELVGASAREVIFTSGATESINLAIQGTIFKHIDNKNKPRIAFFPLEHKAVLDTFLAICSAGARSAIAPKD